MSPASPLPDPSFYSPCIISAQTLLHGCHCLWSCVCRTLPRASRCWGRGWDEGGGSPHKSQPSPASSPPQPLSQPDKGALALTLPVPRTVSSCRREHDRDSFKNIWSFAPHRCATSQMWRPDRSPPEGPSFLFQSGCFELSSAASPI